MISLLMIKNGRNELWWWNWYVVCYFNIKKEREREREKGDIIIYYNTMNVINILIRYI